MPDDEEFDEEFNEEFDLTGTHAFLFVDHVAESARPEEVVGSLRERPVSQVLYASTFVGDYQAFAHLRAEAVNQDGIAELQDLIEGVVRIGARCTYGVETHVQPFGAKRRSPGLIALTRMRVASSGPGIVEARRRFVADGFDRPPGFVGISLMTGDLGVLLQTTGDTLEGVYDTVGAVVALLEGFEDVPVKIDKTSTSFASGDRTSMRHPRTS